MGLCVTPPTDSLMKCTWIKCIERQKRVSRELSKQPNSHQSQQVRNGKDKIEKECPAHPLYHDNALKTVIDKCGIWERVCRFCCQLSTSNACELHLVPSCCNILDYCAASILITVLKTIKSQSWFENKDIVDSEMLGNGKFTHSNH